MIALFALLIPTIAGSILLLFFRSKVVWWEIVLLFGYTLIYILVARYIAITSLTTDIEFVSGYVQEVRYYEPWNEYIHRTCCHKCGKSTCCHDCSYVRYHAAHWQAVSTVGTFEITENRYKSLINQFHASPQFVDMHRHYHTIDGDMYKGLWKGEDETLEPAVAENTYENKPKASLSLFHYKELDTTELRTHKPMEYPEIFDVYRQDCLFGITDGVAHRKLQILNSRLGIPRKVKAFIRVYLNQPREAALAQEAYWQGSNRNEIVVCIGINDAKEIQWVHDFSWTDEQQFKVEVKSFIEQQKTLDLSSAISFLYSEIDTKWKEKDFHDFDYIDIEPTIGQLVFIYLLALLSNGLISWWIVENDFEQDGRRSENDYYGTSKIRYY